jgi:hypothetical protein
MDALRMLRQIEREGTKTALNGLDEEIKVARKGKLTVYTACSHHFSCSTAFQIFTTDGFVRFSAPHPSTGADRQLNVPLHQITAILTEWKDDK